MILLSDVKIGEIISEFTNTHMAEWGSEPSVRDKCGVIAKAQVKEILKWGIEPCLEHATGGGVFTRRECPKCWQELRKELEE